jgi:hypothetical protein
MIYPHMTGLGDAAPITCTGFAVPLQIRVGNGVNAADPANWMCSVPNSVNHGIGYVAFGGAALALLLLPGGWKLLALPLGFVGLQYSLSGSGLI